MNSWSHILQWIHMCCVLYLHSILGCHHPKITLNCSYSIHLFSSIAWKKKKNFIRAHGIKINIVPNTSVNSQILNTVLECFYGMPLYHNYPNFFTIKIEMQYLTKLKKFESCIYLKIIRFINIILHDFYWR